MAASRGLVLPGLSPLPFWLTLPWFLPTGSCPLVPTDPSKGVVGPNMVLVRLQI